MVLVNKWVLTEVPGMPISFLWLQLVFAVILMYGCHTLNWLPLGSDLFSAEKSRKLMPLIATNVIGLVINTFCLKYISASMYQVARSMVIPFTAGIQAMVLRDYLSMRVIGSCVVVCLGFVIGLFMDGFSDDEITIAGVVFGVLSSLATAYRAVLVKSRLDAVDGEAMKLVWYNNLLSAAGVFPLVLVSGEMFQIDAVFQSGTGLSTLLIGLFVTGVFGLLINLAGFLQIQVTSPVTSMISGSIRGVLQTILAVSLLGDHLTDTRIAGIILITVGSGLYTYFKSIEPQHGLTNSKTGISLGFNTSHKIRVAGLTLLVIAVLYIASLSSFLLSRSPAEGIRDRGPEILSAMMEAFTYGEFRLKPQRRYSSVYCRELFDRAQCLFSNVAVKNPDILILYEDPDDPIDFLTSRVREAHPKLVPLRGGDLPEKDREYMKIEKRKGPIPDDASYIDSDLNVLYEPHYPDNLGHFLMEDLFAAFSLMFNFGLVRDEMDLVILKDCGFSPTCFKVYTEKILGVSSKRLPRYLTGSNYPPGSELDMESRQGIGKHFMSSNGLFFQNVLTGTGGYHLRSSVLYRPVPWQMFRTMYLDHFRNLTQEPKSQLITISVKRGRRAVKNIDEVIRWARGFGIPVKLIEPPGATWRHELELLSNSTIHFTVPGGISFSSAFLNPKSVGVIVDLWNGMSNTSESFENFWWEHSGSFHSMNYVLEFDEVEVPPGIEGPRPQLSEYQRADIGLKNDAPLKKLTKEQKAVLVTHHSQYVLREAKFKDIICKALMRAEDNYGWHQSFDHSCLKHRQ